MQTLIIDNYDSYTFNLYQLLAAINGREPIVIRNDEMTWEEVEKLTFDNIVLSPGPGHPKNSKDFGMCKRAIEQTKVPLLGVCLGHQGIAQIFGGKVILAPEVMHGCTSAIYHQGEGLFTGIPQGFEAVRYHSLIVDNQYFPNCLKVTAWTKDGLIMALQHQNRPLWGVQFHPESICTDFGAQLLRNFTTLTQQYHQQSNTLLIYKKNNNTKRKSIFRKKEKTLISNNEWKVFSKQLAFFPEPEKVFNHFFKEDKNAFWLDSSLVEKDLSRFSFMGGSKGDNSLIISYKITNNEVIVEYSNGTKKRLSQSIFDYLRSELTQRKCTSNELPFDFNGGFVGYLGYELKAECGGQQAHASPFPDATFLFADQLIAFDHETKTTFLVYVGRKNEAEKANKWLDNMSKKLWDLPAIRPFFNQNKLNEIPCKLNKDKRSYIADIQSCMGKIRQGESYEICLTNELYSTQTTDPLAFYNRLRKQSPAPYAAFLRFGTLSVACSSPERFLKIDRDRWIESKPIKGTARRGDTFLEDLLLKEQLANSEKDRAENLMIVDLLRNDLGRVCEVGSVEVSKLMAIESYASVHQMVSTICGHLKASINAVDAVKHAFPGGSMTGAPKIRTMSIIDELEGRARGIYSGAIGYFGLNGTADLNIVIRTAVCTPSGISIGTGGAITALSDPESEFEELLLKAKALVETLGLTTEQDLEARGQS